MKDVELLAPAGSYEILKAVIAAGADAVYVGGGKYGARAYAFNFTEEELIEAIQYVHLRGKKLYLTVNTLLKNKEIGKELYDYLLPYYKNGLDAVLVQDLGVLKFIHHYFPDLPIHASTQMTVTSRESAIYLKSLGVERVVVSRELSIKEMKEIYDATHMELEAFVHGALCYSYSGMCLFSSLIGGRSGNRGRCAQPCRLSYQVSDSSGLIKEDSYILSLKDLCGIDDLMALQEAGICSLKIEGRMKKLPYAYGVTALYRKAIDQKPYRREELTELGNRGGFTHSYYSLHNDSKMITYQDSSLHNSSTDNPDFEEKKIPINGNGVFLPGQAMQLSVWDAKGNSFTAEGNTVDTAQNKPVSREDIISRLSKTGATDFVFEDLDCQVGDNIFAPNGAMNALRRDALEGLKNMILDSFLRDSEREFDHTFSENESGKTNPQGGRTYIASVMTDEQLKAVLDWDCFEEIYLELAVYPLDFAGLAKDIEGIHQNGKKAFLRIPTIIRDKDLATFETQEKKEILGLADGFVANGLDAYALIKRIFPQAKIIADYGLYTFNDYAVKELLEEGIYRITAPLELNKKELAHRNLSANEIMIYGRYPLMQTANCICKNSKGCRKTPEFLYLTDRKNAQNPVYNYCNYCYNTIYNSAITNLLPVEEELADMGMNHFRFSFTTESFEEINTILKDFMERNRYNQNSNYTYGHYKRGVE